MEKEFDFENKKDSLDDLVKRDKKSKKGWALLLLLMFLGVIFYAYGVYAPNKKVLAFENLPGVVYQSETVVRGINAKPGAKIKLLVNSLNPIYIFADEDGTFSSTVALKEGENKLEVFIVGEENTNNTSAIVTYEIKEPNLEIWNPEDDSEVEVGKGVKEMEIVVDGKTDSDTNIKINGKEIEVNENGEFNYRIVLKIGDNNINIVADNGKKETEKNIQVKLVEQTSKQSSNDASQNTVTNNNSSNNSSSSSNSGSSSNNNPTNPINPEEEPQPIVVYPSKVIISYIAYTNDPNTTDYGEYIEIKNTGGENKDITGWTVSDGDGNYFTFPSYILMPGSSVRVTTNTGRFVFNSSSPVWAKVGEPGYLKDASGRLVDIYSY